MHRAVSEKEDDQKIATERKLNQIEEYVRYDTKKGKKLDEKDTLGAFLFSEGE